VIGAQRRASCANTLLHYSLVTNGSARPAKRWKPLLHPITLRFAAGVRRVDVERKVAELQGLFRIHRRPLRKRSLRRRRSSISHFNIARRITGPIASR
jgi:hypothetical protein